MITPFITAEQSGRYTLTRPVSQEEILAMAKCLIQRRFNRGRALTSPAASKEYLMLQLATLEHEVFCSLFLDNQHRVLAFETLFVGTIDSASVYPREVLKRTLQLNAKAMIFAHNHPSGISEPSIADREITRKLIEGLALIDVRVLDHFIVGGDSVVSFAEMGWM